MIINKQVNVLLILPIVFTVQSCKKMLEISPPKSEISAETVFKDASTATAALTSIYYKMAGNEGTSVGLDLTKISGVYSDELQNQNSNYRNYYLNFMNGNAINPSSMWSVPFTYIYEANIVLEGVQKSDKLNEKVKKQLSGEALFIRSFWFYYLIELYGTVPYIVTTDYSVNQKLPGLSQKEILLNLITDLKRAEELISSEYMNGNTNGVTVDRVRPNKAAVRALLARVFLTAGEYVLAEQYSTQVINDVRYGLAMLDEVFLVNSVEAIWQVAISFDNSINYATIEGQYLLINQPNPDVSLSRHLLQAFEDGDRRLKSWVGIFTAGPKDTLYFPNKYKLAISNTPIERSTILRLAEQYLIRSEARCRLGELAGAAEDISLIRNRAGLGIFKTSSQKLTFQAIVEERRREFFCEWGHRWIDMKRLDVVDSIMHKEATFKGAIWATYKKLWPLPESDLNRNPNLKQNPGY
ncbi:RagB/SusD family nutrient uptake outer membrane protein [Chitinophaga pendula]|uniref:RagB/SusD family nutrient uptake outer membrane protein n=1 Tax=Chitinophaga TaxID=79328 RepID=UPI000BAFE9C8|nr:MULTISPECIES: RagB/SusD family nutrient uptake outer membrane protein [Chitinophaga]ASZ13895.1 RagB/SusD family nutrient uptake outer membrane protein [Chitinophaga sp. MD30]UCJ08485.1 RagB/SusD family nutrient uptake outer membrane protein [Chitinophaga pendula]